MPTLFLYGLRAAILGLPIGAGEDRIPARIEPRSSAVRVASARRRPGVRISAPCPLSELSPGGDGVVFVHKNVMELPVYPPTRNA